jgi:membrane protease YdiL (CAAX protease family)
VNDSTSATSPVWPTRWPKDSFKGVWTWILTAIFVLLVFALAIAQLNQGSTAIPINPAIFDAAMALQIVVELAFAAIVIAVLPALSKFSLRELGFGAPTLSTIGIAIVGFGAMFVVADGSASLIESLAHSRHQQDIVQIFKMLHNPTSIVIFVIFAIVFAPFAEETFFRLFFFNVGLRYGGFWGGAVLSGVMFGIVHGDIFAAVPLALGGMVLCGVYYVTRNAYASMISHALFNGFSIAALLISPKIT